MRAEKREILGTWEHFWESGVNLGRLATELLPDVASGRKWKAVSNKCQETSGQTKSDHAIWGVRCKLIAANANLLIFAKHLYEYQNENTSDLQRRFVLRLDYSVRYVYYYVYSPQRRLLIKGPNPTSRTIILLLSPAKKEMKKETKKPNCVCVCVEVGNWGQTNKKLGETVLKLCISICVWLCVFVSLCVYIYACVCFLGVANWVCVYACVCMYVCVGMCVFMFSWSGQSSRQKLLGTPVCSKSKLS